MTMSPTVELDGVELAELNLRAVVAAIVSGCGEGAFGRLCGVLGVPSMGDKTWDRAEKRVVSALQAAGEQSCAKWLDRERERAIAFGCTMRVVGRVPIPIAFDAQWLKPGRAHNAPDGYGCSMAIRWVAAQGSVFVPRTVRSLAH